MAAFKLDKTLESNLNANRPNDLFLRHCQGLWHRLWSLGVGRQANFYAQQVTPVDGFAAERTR